MFKCLLLEFCLIGATFALSAKNITGVVLNETSQLPVEFVNIGIVYKNVGTVSNANGQYRLFVDTTFYNDTLLFSCIGYEPRTIKISDLQKDSSPIILLREKVYEIKDVVIIPRQYKEKTLGVTSKSKAFQMGFEENILGYEMGLLMNVKKTALLKRVNINIAHCSYDTIFYRLNIYKVFAKNFENILREPIYINIPKELTTNEIHVDLLSKNIVVEGDFLIALEHVKDLGKGGLYFSFGLMHTSYLRTTSQGEWEKVPIGMSINVIADVEK
ncbi:hypothetical protein AGMMS4956_20140 [Bacteroidia bacterium]|nr:hypothetical protein AGMMS4956_20140 [Bacteroidia bacterium]